MELVAPVSQVPQSGSRSASLTRGSGVFLVSARILSASARLGFNRNTLRKKLLEHGLEDGDDAA